MNRPRLLDLFCGAGGCAAGYAAAGFDVTGVDIRPQKNWPKYLPGIKECRTADALEFVDKYGRHYDVITASPPCQRYTHASFTPSNRERHQDLVAVTRGLLMAAGKPYVIENVMGAPLEGHCLMLCGLMFQLKVFRHRWFESNQLLLSPPHPSHNGHLIGKAGIDVHLAIRLVHGYNRECCAPPKPREEVDAILAYVLKKSKR